MIQTFDPVQTARTVVLLNLEEKYSGLNFILFSNLYANKLCTIQSFTHFIYGLHNK